MRVRTSQISKENAPLLYVEGPIATADRISIERVGEADGIKLWHDIIYPDPTRFAVRLLPDDHWARHSDDGWASWREAVNCSPEADELVTAIGHATCWEDQDAVLFMATQRVIFKTPWGVFLRHWRQFLWMNDEPLVIRPNHGLYLCFGSGGGVGWGRRPVHEMESQLEWLPPELAIVGIL